MKRLSLFDFIDSVTITSLLASYLIFNFTLPATIKWVCYVIDLNSITQMLKLPLFLTLPLVIICGITVTNLIFFRLAYLAGIKLITLMLEKLGI